jgi:hypothetical protein
LDNFASSLPVDEVGLLKRALKWTLKWEMTGYVRWALKWDEAVGWGEAR